MYIYTKLKSILLKNVDFSAMIFHYEQYITGFDNSKRRVLLSHLIISRLQLNNNYSQQFKYTIYDSFIKKLFKK